MIIRRCREGSFTSIPDSIWEDESLSVEAKGALGYLLSRRNNWNARVSYLRRVLGVGKDKMYGIVNQLIASGYVTRDQPRSTCGTFDRMEYIVSDERRPQERKTP
jgi:hypothetical protein